MVIGGFRPSSPPVMNTPENVLNAAVATKCVGMFCVPAFIEVCSGLPELEVLNAYSSSHELGMDARPKAFF